MESDDGFRSFSEAIESDPIAVLLAKWRRDAFISKLEQLPDVAEVIESGSLARGTHIGPVHDVDLIVVFKSFEHPDYGAENRSAEAVNSAQAAITHLENELGEQLHPWLGPREGPLKETEQRKHVVTCYADWTVALADIIPIPVAPPVDVMPAVRKGSRLSIPERGTGWIDVDPEKFMRKVEQRQREWKYFKEVVGMVNAWAEHNHLGMSNLAVEVMVLKYCPRPGWFETLSCGEAVAQFFEAAAKANITSLKDPAGRCGEIDPGMNYMKLRAALDRSAGLARQAMDAEHAWKHRFHATEDVTHPDVFWRKLFGSKYPRARKRFFRAPATEPWAGKYTVKITTTADLGGPDYPDRADYPDPRRPNWPDGGDPKDPDQDPDNPNLGPHPPGDGSRRPRPPFDMPSRRPGAPRDDGGTPPRPRPRRPGYRPVPGEPGTNLWTGVFSQAAAAVSVPLTFG